MTILIPMAGEGERFSHEGFSTPKPLIKINGREMIFRAIKTLGFRGDYIFIIRDHPESGQLELLLEDFVNDDINFPHVNSVQILKINTLTDGPACTALLAKDIMDSGDSLVIANCDQIMWWDGSKAQFFLENSGYDGALVTYYCSNTKNSYVKINRSGLVTEVREKEVISDISTNGIHFWRKASHFFRSAQTAIDLNDRSINGEFYIAPTYNHLINEGREIGIYHVPNFQHHAVGTPDDLRHYISL